MNTVVLIIAVIVLIPIFIMGLVTAFGYGLVIWQSFKDAKRLGSSGKDEYGFTRRDYLWMGGLTLAWVIFVIALLWFAGKYN